MEQAGKGGSVMEQISIRAAKIEDAAALVNIYGSYVTDTAITYEYVIPSVEEFAKRMETILQKYPYLVAEKDGEIVGYAYADAFHERAAYGWSVETSIYLAPNRKRMGIGKCLYDELERILKLQKIIKLIACIAYPEQNDEYLTQDSVRFHEHLGYQMAGILKNSGYKFHRWYHTVWMDKWIGEPVEQQEPIIPFVPEMLEKNWQE